MNKNLEQAVQAAIDQIKTLSSDKIQILKAEFDKIHCNAISAEESWYKLVNSGSFDYCDVDTEEAFSLIGNLITVSARGPLTIIQDAYDQDKPGDLSLLQYVSQTGEEIYKLMDQSI